MKSLLRRRKVIVPVAIVVCLGLIYFFRQNISDWWKLETYQPSSSIVALARETTMTNKARRLFYVAHADLEDSAEFNKHCTNDHEGTIVLGCYDGKHIYIYDVTDPQFNGVQQVTAAHEMLHAAYSRLSKSELAKVNNMIEAQLKSEKDPYILGLAALYNRTEPGELLNEMHSVFGTQVADLSPQLNAYYAQYFTNRQVIVNYAKQYQAIFIANDTEMTSLSNQLTALNTTINADNKTLTTENSSLQVQLQNLNTLRASDNVSSYNALVDPYNQAVNTFNSLLTTTQKLVTQYNSLVKQLNQISIATTKYSDDLNSHYQPVAANSTQ
jgi:hypothetical protein